jgi:hypothetical protein
MRHETIRGGTWWSRSAAALSTAALMMAGTQPSEAATGTVGAHSAKSVSCNTTMNMAAPTILAANSTSGLDSQKVIFQALLFKWNGSIWTLAKSGQALEGTATDAASPTTWFDYGLGYMVGAGRQTFTVGKGHYKVAIQYWWLANDGSTSGYDYKWAPTYITQIGAVASYCTY